LFKGDKQNKRDVSTANKTKI